MTDVVTDAMTKSGTDNLTIQRTQPSGTALTPHAHYYVDIRNNGHPLPIESQVVGKTFREPDSIFEAIRRARGSCYKRAPEANIIRRTRPKFGLLLCASLDLADKRAHVGASVYWIVLGHRRFIIRLGISKSVDSPDSKYLGENPVTEWAIFGWDRLRDVNRIDYASYRSHNLNILQPFRDSFEPGAVRPSQNPSRTRPDSRSLSIIKPRKPVTTKVHFDTIPTSPNTIRILCSVTELQCLPSSNIIRPLKFIMTKERPETISISPNTAKIRIGNDSKTGSKIEKWVEKTIVNGKIGQQRKRPKLKSDYCIEGNRSARRTRRAAARRSGFSLYFSGSQRKPRNARRRRSERLPMHPFITSPTSLVTPLTRWQKKKQDDGDRSGGDYEDKGETIINRPTNYSSFRNPGATSESNQIAALTRQVQALAAKLDRDATEKKEDNPPA
ncbi:hypothetical protein EVAR_83513_1 [Eumeta japonica]|uniref:Uncharacterized protein n=1 Tax=Eumeta variegata TaxID=151549 RepID=A0A4C1XZW9_EUMVA|nr:hypothetical protein EVAR_83513_1 [Eumeta japonica]